MPFITIIRDTAANFTSHNPTLPDNQFGVETNIVNGLETDTGKMKLGNGRIPWNSLLYIDGSGVVGTAEGTAATGTLTVALSGVANSATIQVNGVTFTFKDISIPSQGILTAVQVPFTPADSPETIAKSLAQVLNASVHASISVATYYAADDVVIVTHDTPGDAGNGFTLADSSDGAITRSAATLAGGVDGLLHDVAAVDAAIASAVATALTTAGKRLRVRAATTAAITIATALNNGDSLDGVTLATGDLVLVKDQAAPAQNGIYVVGVTPARSAEFDTFDEHAGSLIVVQEGSANADSAWISTTDIGGILGTNDIDFARITSSFITQTVTNGVTTKAPSEDAVFDALALKANDTRPVLAKTADYPVVVGDHDTIFTNAGAGGIVKFTLPDGAGCVAGKTRFTLCVVAAQVVRIEPVDTDHLFGYSDPTTTSFDASTGAFVASGGVIGETMTIVFLGGTTWLATSVSGSWVV